MAEETWYAIRNDEQIGPVAQQTLAEMASTNDLSTDDLVWEAGTPDWVPARQVGFLCAAAGWGEPALPAPPMIPRPSFHEQVQPQIQSLRSRVGELDRTSGAVDALPHLRYVHGLLANLRRQVTVHQLDAVDRIMKRLGSVAYMVAAALYGAFFVIVSLRADSIQQLLLTLLIIIPGATICHYIAVHFLESSDELLSRTRTELSSPNLAMSLGLLVGTGGLAIIALASQDLFRKIAAVESIFAIAVGLIFLYVAAVCFNPESVSTSTVGKAGAAREAIGISMFLAKLPLRLVPLTFGLTSAAAAASAVFFCHQLYEGTARYDLAMVVAPRALLVALLPTVLFLLSAFAFLLADVFRSSLDMSEGIQELVSLESRPQTDRK